MVRKTKEEAQETYGALLDAAEREFRTKGVTNTTLNEIAKAAGMTRGAIYWHFKDKTDLFQAMCDRAFLPMESLLNEIVATSDADPMDALRQLTSHMLILIASDERRRNVCEILFHRCEKTDEIALLMEEKKNRRECLKRVEVILHNAVKQQKLASDTDTVLAAHAIHSYLVGLIYEWLMDPDAYNLEQHGEAMMDIFLAGLIARPPLKKPKRILKKVA